MEPVGSNQGKVPIFGAIQISNLCWFHNKVSHISKLPKKLIKHKNFFGVMQRFHDPRVLVIGRLIGIMITNKSSSRLDSIFQFSSFEPFMVCFFYAPRLVSISK